MAITDKEQGVWGLDQVYNKINQGSIWEYTGAQELWTAGWNIYGQLGQNSSGEEISSPVQVPGTTWAEVSYPRQYGRGLGMKTDGSIWGFGANSDGNLGMNNETAYSSPVQIMAGPGSVGAMEAATKTSLVQKSDGTLWGFGDNGNGQLGQNSRTKYSSPIQITGTWSKNISLSTSVAGGVKTDGTLWMWGQQSNGVLGQNETYSPSKKSRSSPVQVGSGTDWATSKGGFHVSSAAIAVKTDGTLWMWGNNTNGGLGQNDKTQRSSPVQVPGTTWSWVGTFGGSAAAVKTDGTLWSWGYNNLGMLGHNNQTEYSSPKQVGSGTDWSKTWQNETVGAGLKTDGTAWMWGRNSQKGQQGHNNLTDYSSPKQVPGNYIWISPANYNAGFIKEL